MLTKRLLGAVFLLLTLLFSTHLALAGPYLMNGMVQMLEDNDYEVWLSYNDITNQWEKQTDLTGTIEKGDLFAGVWEIQGTKNVPGNLNATDFGDNNETFTGLFLIEADVVTDKTVAEGNFDTITFKATSTQNWLDVFGTGKLIDISSEFDVNTLQKTGAGGTLALLFDNVTQLSADETLPSLSASASSYASGDLQYELGFTGASGTDEFWRTEGIGIASPVFAPTYGINWISMNITQQYEGPDLQQHNHAATLYPFAGFNNGAQVQGRGDFGNDPAGAWNIGTNTNFYILPTPEPSTLALFGLGLLGISAITRRKKG